MNFGNFDQRALMQNDFEKMIIRILPFCKAESEGIFEEAINHVLDKIPCNPL